jgi:hypothetical protein
MPITKEILSPPSYALDHAAHFGRWQSITHKNKSKRNHSKSPSLPSPPPSIASNSPTMLFLPPINISMPTILPPPPSPIHPNLDNQHKWMILDDYSNNNRLPPLREIMNNKHASESYAPPIFPIDNSFFRR